MTPCYTKAMKQNLKRAARVLQILGVILLTVYFFLIRDANKEFISFPFFGSLPTAWGVLLVFLLGIGLGVLLLLRPLLRAQHKGRQLNRKLSRVQHAVGEPQAANKPVPKKPVAVQAEVVAEDKPSA